MDARIKKGLRGQNGSEQASLLKTYRTSTTTTATQEEPKDEKGGRLLLLREDALCNEWLKKINLSNKIRLPQTQI